MGEIGRALCDLDADDDEVDPDLLSFTPLGDNGDINCDENDDEDREEDEEDKEEEEEEEEEGGRFVPFISCTPFLNCSMRLERDWEGEEISKCLMRETTEEFSALVVLCIPCPLVLPPLSSFSSLVDCCNLFILSCTEDEVFLTLPLPFSPSPLLF